MPESATEVLPASLAGTVAESGLLHCRSVFVNSGLPMVNIRAKLGADRQMARWDGWQFEATCTSSRSQGPACASGRPLLLVMLLQLSGTVEGWTHGLSLWAALAYTAQEATATGTEAGNVAVTVIVSVGGTAQQCSTGRIRCCSY
eukprot:COSAG01_NODE_3185_length_6428_cov_3.036722_1_plen_145_part_00